MSEAKFERRVEVSGAYNHLRPDPHENYGIGACRIWFYLIGPKGAVQFQVGTEWHTESARAHLLNFPRDRAERCPLSGWDLGYHAREPRYEGQTPRSCHLLGGECFYDGSSLNADEMIEAFINGGTTWLWPHLELYYACTFEGGEFPQPIVVPRPYPSKRVAPIANPSTVGTPTKLKGSET